MTFILSYILCSVVISGDKRAKMLSHLWNRELIKHIPKQMKYQMTKRNVLQHHFCACQTAVPFKTVVACKHHTQLNSWREECCPCHCSYCCFQSMLLMVFSSRHHCVHVETQRATRKPETKLFD